MKTPLADQVVVVLGASSGIGRATARAAGRRGARVVVAARNADAWPRRSGGRSCRLRGIAVVTDTTSEAELEALRRAVERPERELPVTWAAQKLLWGQKLSPRAGDLVLLRNGWKGQTTGEPKPVDSPDNLYASIPGDPGARGRFDEQSRSGSGWTEARLRLGKVGSIAALAGPVAALAIGYHEVTKRR